MLGRVRGTIRRLLHRLGYRLEKINPDYPILARSIDPLGVKILVDSEFQSSCREISGLTLLDLPRLANLWQLCRMSNRQGGIIEIGSYKGGTALHLSNSCPDRRIVVCDSFEGFEIVEAGIDSNFNMSMFKDIQSESVERLFRGKHRNSQVVVGFFPRSCRGVDLRPISFAHVDVDTHKATIEALLFLADCMMDKSIIILDDYDRRAAGVNRAIGEFLKGNRLWIALPMFPSQAVLIHRTWFD